jgi:hypothetical protein
MDQTCKFGQEYLPLRDGRDPVLELHLENCPDCQDQVTVV